MKYYDGFGKDVTEYVQGLEQRIIMLEKKIYAFAPNVEPEAIKVEEIVAKEKEEGIGKVDLSKAKRKRSKKKVNANTQ